MKYLLKSKNPHRSYLYKVDQILIKDAKTLVLLMALTGYTLYFFNNHILSVVRYQPQISMAATFVTLFNNLFPMYNVPPPRIYLPNS